MGAAHASTDGGAEPSRLRAEFVTGEGELPREQSSVAVDAEQWRGRNLSLPELLAELPGISVRTYGGVGAYAELSMRGVNGGRVLVFWDDQLLNDAHSGAVDLGKIDPASIGSVEVFRGFLPGEYGADGVGGAIVLRSRERQEERVRAEFAYGSYNTHRHSVSVGGPNGTTAFSVVHSDNDYDYLDRNRTPYNKNDDTVRALNNAEYTSFALTHRSTVSALGGSLRRSFSLRSDWGGLPGAEGARTVSAGYENRAAQAGLSWGRDLPFPGEADLELGLGGRLEWNRMEWGDEDHLSNITRGDVTLENETDALNATARLHWNPVPAWEIALAERAGAETLVPRNLAGQANWDWDASRLRSQSSLSLARRFSRRMRLGVQGAVDVRAESAANGATDDSIERSDVDGSARVVWSFAPTPSLLFHSYCARGVQAPTLRERFGARRGTLPSPDLRSEESVKWEIGFSRSTPLWSVEGAFHDNRLDRTVVFVTSGELSKAINVGAARVTGAELLASVRPARWASFRASGEWTRAVDRGSVRAYRSLRLPNVPEWTSRLGATFSAGPVETDLRLALVSPFWRDRANRRRVDAAAQLGCGARWQATPRLRFSVQFEDLLDRAPESAYSSYPSPGRTVLVGVQAGFLSSTNHNPNKEEQQ